MYHNYAVDNAAEMDEEMEYLRKNSVYADSDIALMPDAHKGKAHASIGFTATYADKIVPNTIGVDLNCRVSLTPLGVADGALDMAIVDKAVQEGVPSGFKLRKEEHSLSKNFDYEALRCWSSIKDGESRYRLSLGTLGGGNHMIEIDRDSQGNLWLLVHTGSRNLGLRVAEHYQALAIKAKNNRVDAEKAVRDKRIVHYRQLCQFDRIAEIQRDFAVYKALEVEDELAYLEGKDMEDYLHDVDVIREWSRRNHEAIVGAVRTGLISMMSYSGIRTDSYSIQCIHNYIDTKHKVIRKGAISAQKGETGIIPLNMRDGVLLVRGKGNPDWNCSLPHGAGRILSRAAANRELSLDDYRQDMSGIYSSCVCSSTLDESPKAYKNADAIMEAIGDNAEIIDHMVPVYNFKAKG